ncbi:co-chaperone GroES [bacterium]|nr:co-chaperone GroES [bacterium]
MRIKPLNDRILVKRLEAEGKTKGGILLPETAKEKPKEGEVISVGPGKILESGKRQSLELKKGDKIIFESYAGTEIKVDGKEYLLMKEDDVLGIIEK